MGDEVCDFSAVKVFSDCPAHVMDQIDEVNLRKHAFNESKSSDFEISTHPTPDMSWSFKLTTSSFLRKPVKHRDKFSMVIE